jgi:YVTN family beta-propeller protein
MTKHMSGLRRSSAPVLVAGALFALAACSPAQEEQTDAAAAPETSAGYKVYVTNEIAGTLSVIDGVTRQTIDTIPLGKRPRGVRASPDGKTLYIALSGSPIAGPNVDASTLPPADKAADAIAVFDVASRSIVRRITGISDPEQLDVSTTGILYIASEDTGQAVVVDSATGKELAKIPVGGEPEGVNITPDGRQVWVTSEEDSTVTVIDTATNAALKTIKVGERPRNTAFSPDGARAYVPGELDHSITVVDRATLEVTQTVKLPDAEFLPMDLKVSADGKTLFVSTGRARHVVALDTETFAVTGTADAGTRVWGIALSPDGSRLYSANGPSNDVSVVDTASMKTIATIPAGERPWSLVIVP